MRGAIELSWETIIQSKLAEAAWKSAVDKYAPTQFLVLMPEGSLQVWADQTQSIEIGLSRWLTLELKRKGMILNGAIHIELAEREEIPDKECMVIAHFAEQGK